MELRSSQPAQVIERTIEKLRVYSISDQDGAGPWIRPEFPDLFYIVQPSTPTGGEYYGASLTTVTNAWLNTNIRAKGPLATVYPRFAFIMEGDTPSISI